MLPRRRRVRLPVSQRIRTLVIAAREHLFKKKINEGKRKGELELSRKTKIDGRKKRKGKEGVPYYGYRSN